jgi:Kef-type K+ transport system membrane component KefB
MQHSPLLLQLVVILGTARILGLLLRYFGQPSVIGEMAAGIVLGPIVLGALTPDFHAQLFAPATLPALAGLSQLGLVLFMFIVGAEIRLPTGVRGELLAATQVGVSSVVLPMILGILAAYLLYPQLAPPGVAFWSFSLFLAAAMSITAFPIMARILKERGMSQTPVGRLSLTSAAIADVLAWILLALVVVLIGSEQNWGQFGTLVFGVTALCLVVFFLLRPLLAWLLRRFAENGKPGGMVLAVLLIGCFGCAYITGYLHVHPVFGAFLFGACLPRDDRLLDALIERIEYVAILVLMPIFFALAGLNTTSSAFIDTSLNSIALILLVAVVGKIAGGALGARLTGSSWRDSCAVGALMNARGLMELIVIKVGLDIGVIDQRLFTILLVMAILTTLMTGPLLSLLNK